MTSKTDLRRYRKLWSISTHQLQEPYEYKVPIKPVAIHFLNSSTLVPMQIKVPNEYKYPSTFWIVVPVPNEYKYPSYCYN